METIFNEMSKIFRDENNNFIDGLNEEELQKVSMSIFNKTLQNQEIKNGLYDFRTKNNYSTTISNSQIHEIMQKERKVSPLGQNNLALETFSENQINYLQCLGVMYLSYIKRNGQLNTIMGELNFNIRMTPFVNYAISLIPNL